jgi:hypothetical protein
LRLLSLAGLPKSIPNLPSWVPNWSFSPLRSPLARDSQDLAYNSLGNQSKHKPEFRFNIPEQTLYVRGGFIDSIVQHDIGRWTPSERNSNSESEVDKAFKALISKLESAIHEAQKHPSNEKSILNDILWKTLTANLDDQGRKAPESYAQIFAAYKAYLDRDLPPSTPDPKAAARPAPFQPFVKAATRICLARKFCVTQKGYIGLIPAEAQAGDSMAVFRGEDVPFVVRRAGETGNEKWVLVGDAFVYGFMYGRGLEDELLDGRMEEIMLV